MTAGGGGGKEEGGRGKEEGGRGRGICSHPLKLKCTMTITSMFRICCQVTLHTHTHSTGQALEISTDKAFEISV